MAPLVLRRRGPLHAGAAKPKKRGRPPTAAARRLREAITRSGTSIADTFKASGTSIADIFKAMESNAAKAWAKLLRTAATVERDEALCVAVAERIARRPAVVPAIRAVARDHHVSFETARAAYYAHRDHLEVVDAPD